MRSSSDTVKTGTALVVGASGIAGSALVDRLADEGWDVVGLSRNPLRRRDVLAGGNASGPSALAWR